MLPPFLNSFLNWLLYTSVFAAFCAVCLCFGTEALLLRHIPAGITALHYFIAGSTLLVYNVHFLFRTAHAHISDRFRWTLRNRHWHFFAAGTGAILCLLSFPALGSRFVLPGLILGLLSFGYTLPLLPFGGKTRLREIGWLKLLVLTVVWTVVTTVLPAIYWQLDVTMYPFEVMIRFSFLGALCIAFDIRDMQTDLKGGIQTLPNLIGLAGSYRLIYALLFMMVILGLLQHLRHPNAVRCLSIVVSAVISALVIRYAAKFPADRVYLGLVDGMMLLHGTLIAFSSYYY